MHEYTIQINSLFLHHIAQVKTHVRVSANVIIINIKQPHSTILILHIYTVFGCIAVWLLLLAWLIFAVKQSSMFWVCRRRRRRRRCVFWCRPKPAEVSNWGQGGQIYQPTNQHTHTNTHIYYPKHRFTRQIQHVINPRSRIVYSKVSNDQTFVYIYQYILPAKFAPVVTLTRVIVNHNL